MDKLQLGREVFDKEIESLARVRDQLDGTFHVILDEIMSCKGKVILIGMGKSGHVARKMAASMSSLGTCAIFLHPGECMHGDLGMIQRQDVVILISHSGESDEILHIIPSIRVIGATLIGITGNADSTLSGACKAVQVMGGIEEACYMGLAPTSSTTAVMVYGDALAVVAARLRGFGRGDFGKFHPAGSLGKSLTARAVDLMRPFRRPPSIKRVSSLYDTLHAMMEADADLIAVVDDCGLLVGIVTNGDLKRAMADQGAAMDIGIEGIVHEYPYFVDESAMAAEALRLMLDKKVHAIPVVRENRPIGVIERREIIKYGIYV